MTTKIIPFSSLPVCAQQCPELNAANDVCVPPAVPEGDPSTYTNCVCTSQTLAGLYNDARAVCAASCPNEADLQAIQSAFRGICGQPTEDDAAQPTAEAPGQATTTGRPVAGMDAPSTQESWIESHWQWIVFVAVLILAMIAFSILGVWLKRRHRRKVDARNANLASTEAVPGPGEGDDPSPAQPLPGTSYGATQTREMSMADSEAAAVAPPRRTFTGRSVRSRSSTMTSQTNGSGPVAWGPHQNMAAGRYDNVPPSPAYASANDYPDRTYSPAVRSPVGTSHGPGSNNGGNPTVYTAYVPPPPPVDVHHQDANADFPIGMAITSPRAESSPVSPDAEKAMMEQSLARQPTPVSAQRIREMQSQESMNRARSTTPASLRSGTPVSARGGSRRI